MHIADVAAGVLGANGIVGQGVGIAVGAAMSIQIQKRAQVALAFFGEGASGAGITHEAMNMAAIWRLPIIFFCEANKYAELSPYETHVSLRQVSGRAAAYGFPGVTIDGEDVLAVYEAVKQAADRARQGGGPSLIEAKTFRWHGHYEGDPQVYKSEEEKTNRSGFDPIARMKERATGVSRERLLEIEETANSKIRDAASWAAGLHSPPPSSLVEDVYASDGNGAD
jgi:pyruvate dehydrogenase E1 component alpha subunit